jgi:hypothetical protein
LRRVRKIAKSDYSLRNVCLSVRPSTWNKSAPTERTIMKFHICVFFENLSRKFKLHSNLTQVTSTLHEDHYIFFFIKSRSGVLRTRNVSEKVCKENQSTHYMFNNFFRKSYRLWHKVEKYRAEPHTPHVTWNIYIACWITKSADTENM